MSTLSTPRLTLHPFAPADFERLVANMLTDSRVVAFYYAYQGLTEVAQIRAQAKADFWAHFEESRADHGLEIWAAYASTSSDDLLGWCGLVHTELSERYGGPELQYMVAGAAHGQGYATEMGAAALEYAAQQLGLPTVIATVDIPNLGSIRVLEKLGFAQVGQITAYGSDDMYLYRKTY